MAKVRRFGKTFAAKGSVATGTPGTSKGRLIRHGKVMAFSQNIPPGGGLVSSLGRSNAVRQYGKQVSNADLTQGRRHLTNRVARPR